MSLALVCCLIASMCCFASASGTDGSKSVVPSPDQGSGTRTNLFTLKCSGLSGTAKKGFKKVICPTAQRK